MDNTIGIREKAANFFRFRTGGKQPPKARTGPERLKQVEVIKQFQEKVKTAKTESSAKAIKKEIKSLTAESPQSSKKALSQLETAYVSLIASPAYQQARNQAIAKKADAEAGVSTKIIPTELEILRELSAIVEAEAAGVDDWFSDVGDTLNIAKALGIPTEQAADIIKGPGALIGKITKYIETINKLGDGSQMIWKGMVVSRAEKELKNLKSPQDDEKIERLSSWIAEQKIVMDERSLLGSVTAGKGVVTATSLLFKGVMGLVEKSPEWINRLSVAITVLGVAGKVLGVVSSGLKVHGKLKEGNMLAKHRKEVANKFQGDRRVEGAKDENLMFQRVDVKAPHGFGGEKGKIEEHLKKMEELQNKTLFSDESWSAFEDKWGGVVEQWRGVEIKEEGETEAARETYKNAMELLESSNDYIHGKLQSLSGTFNREFKGIMKDLNKCETLEEYMVAREQADAKLANLQGLLTKKLDELGQEINFGAEIFLDQDQQFARDVYEQEVSSLFANAKKNLKVTNMLGSISQKEIDEIRKKPKAEQRAAEALMLKEKKESFALMEQGVKSGVFEPIDAFGNLDIKGLNFLMYDAIAKEELGVSIRGLGGVSAEDFKIKVHERHHNHMQTLEASTKKAMESLANDKLKQVKSVMNMEKALEIGGLVLSVATLAVAVATIILFPPTIIFWVGLGITVGGVGLTATGALHSFIHNPNYSKEMLLKQPWLYNKILGLGMMVNEWRKGKAEKRLLSLAKRVKEVDLEAVDNVIGKLEKAESIEGYEKWINQYIEVKEGMTKEEAIEGLKKWQAKKGKVIDKANEEIAHIQKMDSKITDAKNELDAYAERLYNLSWTDYSTQQHLMDPNGTETLMNAMPPAIALLLEEGYISDEFKEVYQQVFGMDLSQLNKADQESLKKGVKKNFERFFANSKGDIAGALKKKKRAEKVELKKEELLRAHLEKQELGNAKGDLKPTSLDDIGEGTLQDAA